MNKIIKWVKKNWSGIMTTVSLLGFGTSLYFTAKAAIKVDRILKEKPISKEERQEKRIEIFKGCVPSTLSIIATIASILFTYKISKKKEMALLSTCLMGQSMLMKYRDEMERTYGEEKEKELFTKSFEKTVPKENDISKLDIEIKDDGKLELFCESITGTFFWDTVENVLLAENESNRTFILKDEITFNEWLLYLGLEPSDEGECMGWSIYAEQYYGYKWKDFNHTKKTDINGIEYHLITYPFMPHADYLSMDEYSTE